jgi:hypothetical protein
VDHRGACRRFASDGQDKFVWHARVPHEGDTVGEHQAPEHLRIDEVHVGVDQARDQVKPLPIDGPGALGHIWSTRLADAADQVAHYFNGLVGDCGSIFNVDEVVLVMAYRWCGHGVLWDVHTGCT